MGALDVKSFRDLNGLAGEAMELAVDCYQLRRALPLDAALRASASQIESERNVHPSNIAEGHSRNAADRLSSNHVRIALGSHAELATHIHVAMRLRFCLNDQTIAISKRREHVGRMLSAPTLERALETKGRGTVAG